jgi:hypothetical protein
MSATLTADPETPLQLCEWLNPITTMEDDFYELHRVRVPGTADWIFQNDTFVQWNDTHDRYTRVLHINGLPGSGKSVLASNIIEQFSDSCICVYSFCRHDDELKQDLVAILRTAIFDLSEQIESYGDQLRRFREEHDFKSDDLESLKFLWRNVLIRQLENSKFVGSIKWVIDGLDESDTAHRHELLNCFGTLRSAKVDLKILIVSRYDEEIDSKLKYFGSKIIEIDAESNSADICKVIQYNIRNSERLSAPHMVEYVTSELESRSGGLFLWVRLVFEELARKRTDVEIKSCLDTMPTSLSQMYARILRNLPSGDLHISKEIFKWILAACRPFSLEELAKALEPNLGRLTNVKLEIKRCCGGLIVVDKRVRLLHMTVAEYAKQASFFVDEHSAHTEIAIGCLESIPLYDTPSDVLLSYSCRYWSHHVQESLSERLHDAILSFLRRPHILTWISTMFSEGDISVLVQALEHDWHSWYLHHLIFIHKIGVMTSNKLHRSGSRICGY